MVDGWYIREYKDRIYLHNKTLLFKDYQCAPGEHDHCELCWARFSLASDDLHMGFYEEASKSWICPDCYNAAASLFGWASSDNHTNDERKN